ncbi:TetR/AcrR family transcriptional regulator [Amycolatopsis acidicola]|uniref:TetR/AcrR family transcriptional regulator n=1 Tax=Amycolatopsis acidicola TaxID=2596893 RepID=A0A5N0UVV7_9PSEU|nr:TetR/AcrR family transcriptional regulator [Amycolatopsis acidicola]KAA9154287.1 TetR/AcrR family transcriptional regulator [Amycolatopsis acidicola]
MTEPRRRGRPPVSSGPTTREIILQAARHVFSEQGYEGTTVTAVARRAGVTRPAVHHYFRTKESLYRALFAATRQAVVAAGAASAGERETLSGRLSVFLWSASRVDSHDRSFARFMAASVLDAFRHPELGDGAQGQLADVREFVDGTLRAAVEAGEIRADTDVPAVTEMLVAVLWGMGLYAGFVGTHEQLESVVEQFCRLLEGTLW